MAIDEQCGCSVSARVRLRGIEGAAATAPKVFSHFFPTTHFRLKARKAAHLFPMYPTVFAHERAAALSPTKIISDILRHVFYRKRTNGAPATQPFCTWKQPQPLDETL